MRQISLRLERAYRCGLATVLVLLGACLFAPQARSQEVTATITGRLTDPSAAPIPGAKVTATDTQRGTQLSTVSNDDGTFNIQRVPVGTWDVKIEKEGFQSAVQKNITLVLNQVARLDFELKVGDVSQSVDVTAAAPVLQTESTQLGTVIDARTNAQIPLATRNYVQLTLLAPGAITVNPTGFKNAQTTFNSSRPYINGNREQSNNFLLDGTDNNQVSDNLVAYAPSVDAIQEFNQITQNASAEFGNFMGGITSVSIKSGTNQFHGNLFEFFRNDKLNANEWQNNLTGVQKNKLRWNMFGGSIGGPIKKDRLFFFADYQGSRYTQPGVSDQVSVLTSAARQGNFGQYPRVVRNPITGVTYPGNVIPTSQLDPVAVAVVNSQYYPQPTNGNLQLNQTNAKLTAVNGDQGDIKVDWNISDKDRLFARYSRSFIDNPTKNGLPLSYSQFGNYPIHNAVIDYTRTISPALVNDFRAGLNYVVGSNGTTNSGLPNLNTQFGLSGVPADIFPSQTINGGYASSFGSAGVRQLFANTVIQLNDTVILTAGNHTMHAGFQFFRERLNTFYSGNSGTAGTFTYNGQFSGLADADFMLGLPSEIGVGIAGGTWGHRGNIMAAFFEDTWRATPKFTVNYGVRWELHTPWVEVKDRQANFAPFSGAVQIAGQSTYYNNSRALYNQYNGPLNFQPRIGLSYSPDQRTVVRAAYSLSSYLEGSGTNLRLPLNPPFTVERLVTYTALPYPTTTLRQGYTPISSPTDPFARANIRLWDPNVRPAIANQWNLSVQRQFGDSSTVQLSYVGQKNTHLIVAQPYRQRILVSPGNTLPSPYLAGNPALSTIGQISGTEANGNQSYNALQAVFQRRLAQGLQGQLSYTWSKCLTDSIGFYGSSGAQAAPQSAYVQNLYNRAAEWGPCFFDAKHNVSGYASYDLPFGRNRAFGKNMNRAADAIVGGWQVNAVLSFHTGFPLTVQANDASGTLARSARANCIASPNVYGYRPATGKPGIQWFDPSPYAAPTAGTFGNCGVGTVRGPGLKTADLSASKRFFITEQQNLELRGEFINFTNTPILNTPARSVANPLTLGLVTGSQGARQIQIGLKYNF
jgi:hypothetical protein